MNGGELSSAVMVAVAAALCAAVIGLVHVPPWAVAPARVRDDDCACVLSHGELQTLVALRCTAPKTGSEAIDPKGLTVDIGRHAPESAELTADGVVLRIGRGRGETYIPWKFLEKQAKKRRAGAWECWQSLDEDLPLPPERVEGFSELTRRTASLLPLEGAVPPTAVLGGFNMHRVKDLSPKDDTERKLGALGTRLRGNVLDICTGLGYTAIGAAARPVLLFCRLL